MQQARRVAVRLDPKSPIEVGDVVWFSPDEYAKAPYMVEVLELGPKPSLALTPWASVRPLMANHFIQTNLGHLSHTEPRRR